MIILDTNVLSALMHPIADSTVSTWLDRQPRSSIWITSITVFEVRFGLHLMVSGKRQEGLLARLELLLERIERRIAPFDEPAAQLSAKLMASRQEKGTPRDLRDTMIAGIVLAQRATLATRNITHFSDISATVVNPWSE
jgi:toxin FitB